MLHLLAVVCLSGVRVVSPTTPCPRAETACTADPNCHAFGVHNGGYQLHGCSDANALVPNNDWIIYVHTNATAANQHPATVAATKWAPLPGEINVDEAMCPTHPQDGGLHVCASPGPPPPPHTHPVPPPVPGRPYEQVGSIDVGTLENTIFWWANATYVLENIGCGYADHAGRWFPAFADHSYARVRDFETGTVVANISSSVGFGFVNAFPDYDHNRLWLFGTPADRCHGNCGACQGPNCPGRPSCTSIQSWWTSLPVPTTFETAEAVVLILSLIL